MTPRTPADATAASRWRAPRASLIALALVLVAAMPAIAASPAAGPPFPARETGRGVYDYAGLFKAETVRFVQSMIDQIEDRTGAQVVVYSQVVGSPTSTTATSSSSATS